MSNYDLCNICFEENQKSILLNYFFHNVCINCCMINLVHFVDYNIIFYINIKINEYETNLQAFFTYSLTFAYLYGFGFFLI
jgi:hypothetical protein